TWLAGSSPTSTTARPGVNPWSRRARPASSATRARSSAAMRFPSMIRAVISIPSLVRRNKRAQRLPEPFRIAIDGDLLEARGLSRDNPYARLGHAQRAGQQFSHRAIGFAAFGDGTNPHLEHGAAVGKGLDTINSVPAAARGYPKRHTDALGGITPRIGH